MNNHNKDDFSLLKLFINCCLIVFIYLLILFIIIVSFFFSPSWLGLDWYNKENRDKKNESSVTSK